MSEDWQKALMELSMAVGSLLSVNLSELEIADKKAPTEVTDELRKSLNHLLESLRLQGIKAPAEEGADGQ